MNNNETNIIQERKKWISEVLSILNCSNDTSTFRALSHIKENLKGKDLDEIKEKRKQIINNLIGLE